MCAKHLRACTFSCACVIRYRVAVGGDTYDEKRCPSWTDRVLWRVKPQDSAPSGQAATTAASTPPPPLRGQEGSKSRAFSPDTPAAAATATVAAAVRVRALTYGCAWECRLSDHKPVFALLEVFL